MHKKLFLILFILILSGCASKNFDMAKMTAELPGPAVYRDPRTIEEIEALKPQLKFPIKLAVTQPFQEGRWGAETNWSPEELNIIESWGGALKETGFASEIVILPTPFSTDCSFKNYYQCVQEQYQKLAARFQADALLVISTINEVNAYPNAFAVLDLTIIGCYIVPAHHVNSHTILEGALIDNRNEYLYAFQRSHSEVRHVSPLAYSNEDKAAKQSREAALRTFGDKMIAEVKKYSDGKPQ
ncbi:hypothetical protein MTYP_02884 [Methylophilaceae bacterium]|nr:hypothetical protein MTYP_02884 [Methylophilaceae bacterium]